MGNYQVTFSVFAEPFQGHGDSFEQIPQPSQALALASPVYYADMFLRRVWNTTRHQPGPGSGQTPPGKYQTDKV